MPVALVTGFGPFEDVEVNASGRVAERLRGARVADHEVVAEVLPTAFARARSRLGVLVAEHAPRAILALGVARDPWPRLERRAVAVVTSGRADVDGEVWLGPRLGDDDVGAAVDAAWLEAARAVAPDARWSDDCGGYVCNALNHACIEVARARDLPALFVHIPRTTDPDAIARTEELARALLAAMIAGREGPA